jgi:uncharacterized protein (DUF952 family)/ribosomal protein S18 acetylase RimI-like enzyme
VLLHLTTPATWRVALSAGSVVTPSLLVDGFIHLSPPEQVRLPADRLFAGRDDVILLVIDPDRLTDDVRWEPGVHGDPASMRFPHLYGPLPVAAVTSVVPYRAGPDGAYAEPAVPDAADLHGRARAFDRSLALRRSPIVRATATGWAARDPRVPASYEHNCLWVDGGVAVAAWVADVEAALAGCDHRRVVLDHEPQEALPDGWSLEEERLMVLGPEVVVRAAGGVDVRRVTSEAMAGLWGPSWRRDVAGISDESVADLVRREAFADAHLRVVDLAVVGDDGDPRSSAQLRIDGATAALEAVMTAPDARGQGWSRAVVGDAVRRARADGCDLVWLIARADDWPRDWYARLGFTDVGARWVASRS